MSKRTFAGLLLLAAAVGIGAVREFLFVNLNYQLDFVANQRAFSYAHSSFQAWSGGWSLSALTALKWALALLFILINLGLAVLLARVRFGDHRYRTALLLGFAAVGSMALLAHVAAPRVVGMATLSIKLLHALQYPVVLLLIWAASWIPQRR